MTSETHSQDLHHLVKNAVKLLTSNSAVTVIQFLQVALLTHFLFQVGYGLFVSLTAFVLSVNQFFDVRVSETTIRFAVEYRTRQDYPSMAAIFKLSYLIDFCTGILAFVVVWLVTPWAATHLLHNPDLILPIHLYAFTLLISTTDNTSSAILRVTDQFTVTSIYAFLMAVLELSAVVIALWLQTGLVGVAAALLIKDGISMLLNTSLAYATIHKEVGWQTFRHSSLRLLSHRYKELGKFLLSTNFIGYVRMISTKLDVLILAYFRTPEEVGLYKVATQLAAMVMRLSDPLLTAVLPDLSRLWVEGFVIRFRSLIKRATILTTALLLPAAIVIILLRVPILRLLFGESFVPAQTLVIVGIWGFVIAGIFFWVWPAFLSLGHPEWASGISTGVAAFQLLVMFLVAPVWGAMGITVTSVTAQLIKHLLSLLLINRLTHSHQPQNTLSIYG